MAGSGGSGELGDPGDPPEDGELPCDLDGEAFTSTMVADHAAHSSKRLRRDSPWSPDVDRGLGLQRVLGGASAGHRPQLRPEHSKGLPADGADERCGDVVVLWNGLL